MASGHTIILASERQRTLARDAIDVAPEGAVVTIREAGRTLDQNALLWSLLSELSRAKPDGRAHVPEMWKNLAMKACGHAVQFENGLDGEPFPVGFRSSRLTKAQMSELIEFVLAYGAQHGVVWSEPTAEIRR